MPFDTDLKTRKKDSDLIVSNIDGVAVKVKKAASKIKDEIIDQTIEINAKSKPYTAAILVEKAVDLKMKGLIYDVKKDFKSFLKDSERYLSKNYSINLSKKDLKAIAAKESLIIDNLSENADVLSSDLKEILLGNLAKGLSTNTLSKALIKLYPAFEGNAETLIRTGVGRLFNEINTTKFQEVGFSWYVWAGPNDMLTREIPCKHYVNKKFEASRLSELSLQRQTLWNCRHAIIPISDSEAKNIKKI